MKSSARSRKRWCEMANIDFWSLFQKTQEYLSRNYAAALIDRLYREMAEYSILTPFLSSHDLEEINVNGWDDIALTYLDGSIRKLDEHFHSPQHAVDVIKRLLHPQRVDINNLVETGFATEEMVAFLCMCIRYGVPFVVAGAISSGKTTFLNAIMSSISDSKRVFTIESGSREFSLIHRNSENKIQNNSSLGIQLPLQLPDNEKYVGEWETYGRGAFPQAEFYVGQSETTTHSLWCAAGFTRWKGHRGDRSAGLRDRALLESAVYGACASFDDLESIRQSGKKPPDSRTA